MSFIGPERYNQRFLHHSSGDLVALAYLSGQRATNMLLTPAYHFEFYTCSETQGCEQCANTTSGPWEQEIMEISEPFMAGDPPTGTNDPFELTADYYSVALSLGLWDDSIQGHATGCQRIFGQWICGGDWDRWMYDGTISGAAFVNRDGNDLPTTFTQTEVLPGEGSDTMHGTWPRPEDNPQTAPPTAFFLRGGLMVNPAPTFPVPDTAGNEFGRVLFTLAQLEDIVLSVQTWARYWKVSHPATFRVTVTGYLLLALDASETAQTQCIIGSA